MGFWKNFAKIATMAAPIVAAPFTGGASLALLGAGAGAAGGALSGGGWKGALTGAGMGAIPGLAGAGKAAGAAMPSLTSGLKSAGMSALTGGVGGDGGGGMGFWDKWGGPILQGAGTAAGIYAGKKATESAQKRSPEELAALTGASGTAGDARQAAGAMMNQGKPWLQQPANYFSTLLSGNRAAMSQAVAAPTAQITQQYRGAERGLEHKGIRGAARDFAASELNRDRASKISGLTTGVQPYAAESLAKLGTDMMGHAGGLYGTAGNIYGNLLGYGQQNRQYARKEGGEAGKSIGALIADLGKVKFGGGGNKALGQSIVKGAGSPQMIPPGISGSMSGLPSFAGGPPVMGPSPMFAGGKNPWENVHF